MDDEKQSLGIEQLQHEEWQNPLGIFSLENRLWDTELIAVNVSHEWQGEGQQLSIESFLQ